MKNAILLHGQPYKSEYYDIDLPSPSNSHWFPWLQKQLLVNEVFAQAPELPHPYAPDWEDYCKEFERFDLSPETILVGHSVGAAFLARWLSEHSQTKVGKVVLVAPYLGIGAEDKFDTFFMFNLSKTIASQTKGLTVYVSDNDTQVIHDSVEALKRGVEGLEIREFKGYGHFTSDDMKSGKFPELLEECLSSAKNG